MSAEKSPIRRDSIGDKSLICIRKSTCMAVLPNQHTRTLAVLDRLPGRGKAIRTGDGSGKKLQCSFVSLMSSAISRSDRSFKSMKAAVVVSLRPRSLGTELMAVPARREHEIERRRGISRSRDDQHRAIVGTTENQPIRPAIGLRQRPHVALERPGLGARLLAGRRPGRQHRRAERGNAAGAEFMTSPRRSLSRTRPRRGPPRLPSCA